MTHRTLTMTNLLNLTHTTNCSPWRRGRSGYPVLIEPAMGGAERRAADRRLPSWRARPLSSAGPVPKAAAKRRYEGLRWRGVGIKNVFRYAFCIAFGCIAFGR